MTQEIVKCANPNPEATVCKNCKRNSISKENEYEEFKIKQLMTKHYVCDGYVSEKKREFDFDKYI